MPNQDVKENGRLLSESDSFHGSLELEEEPIEEFAYKPSFKERFVNRLLEVNKELWVILSLFVLIGLMNYLVASQRILLGLYTLPTLFSAYFFGRRHATLTAILSIIMVGLLVYYNPSWLSLREYMPSDKWRELAAWGGDLDGDGLRHGNPL